MYNFKDLVVNSESFSNNTNITTLNIYHAEDELTSDFMSKFRSLTELQYINIQTGINVIEVNSLSFFNVDVLKQVTISSGASIDIRVFGNKYASEQKGLISLYKEDGSKDYSVE